MLVSESSKSFVLTALGRADIAKNLCTPGNVHWCPFAANGCAWCGTVDGNAVLTTVDHATWFGRWFLGEAALSYRTTATPGVHLRRTSSMVQCSLKAACSCLLVKQLMLD